MERIQNASFCEDGRCFQLAAWRIWLGSENAALCPRHAILSMKNHHIWGQA
jgi:hypothetical protein